MNGAFDLAILGSGFGGSLLAMVARRLGLSVLLLERGSHPRFAIGESSSPLANLLLEELACDYDLPRLLPLAQYGSWKRAYPQVGVGLKRGFSFYHHCAGQGFGDDPGRQRQLLVAASPSDEVADTHWYRADLDHFLVREAQSLGADYADRVELQRLRREGCVCRLDGVCRGRPAAWRARFVVDASGPRGALSRLLRLPEARFPGLPATQALFTHFTGVERFARVAGNAGEAPPYPPDDAALHHVFEGGWMWVLRFDSGITSAGFALQADLAAKLALEEGAGGWLRLMQRFPSVARQFERAEPILPFVHALRLPYRCGRVAGAGWALLPSAAAFVDPLFSTGFPLTLLGIQRLGRALQAEWRSRGWNSALRLYAELTAREARAAAHLIGACYAAFDGFEAFTALSMLYFVAASYSEMARRLGRQDLASEFLLQDRPDFRMALRRHCTAALRGAPSSAEALAADLEPFNIAGLCTPGKRNWYGVDLEDVVCSAGKLGQTPEAVRSWFTRMGW